MKTETMAVIVIILLVAISFIAVVVLDSMTGQATSLKKPSPPPIPGRNTHALEPRDLSESSTQPSAS